MNELGSCPRPCEDRSSGRGRSRSRSKSVDPLLACIRSEDPRSHERASPRPSPRRSGSAARRGPCPGLSRTWTGDGKCGVRRRRYDRDPQPSTLLRGATDDDCARRPDDRTGLPNTHVEALPGPSRVVGPIRHDRGPARSAESPWAPPQWPAKPVCRDPRRVRRFEHCTVDADPLVPVLSAYLAFMIDKIGGTDEGTPPGLTLGLLRRSWSWVRGLMRDRPPSGYSPISPRRPDGTHGPIFPSTEAAKAGSRPDIVRGRSGRSDVHTRGVGVPSR